MRRKVDGVNAHARARTYPKIIIKKWEGPVKVNNSSSTCSTICTEQNYIAYDGTSTSPTSSEK